ncbi:MAG TPA: hypothetical protein VGY58_22800, partial [Gemmataceae bacterium]|nr:hypothetical protein [Gemmataceae bacterium]
QQFREMIRNGPNVKPAWAVAAGWERVERGVFAVAINNAEQRFAKLWLQAPPDEVPADVNAAVAKTTALVFGIDYDGEIRADLFALSPNRDDAVAVANSVLLWVSKGLTAIQESSQKAPDKVAPGMPLAEKFLERVSVGLESAAGPSKPAIVHAKGHAKISLSELFGLLSGAKVEAVEVKQK